MDTLRIEITTFKILGRNFIVITVKKQVFSFVCLFVLWRKYTSNLSKGTRIGSFPKRRTAIIIIHILFIILLFLGENVPSSNFFWLQWLPEYFKYSKI